MFDKLDDILVRLEEILNDPEKLKDVMKDELRKVKKEYATPRKTEIQEEVEEIKIDSTQMINKEDCIVCVTNEGYVKRVSTRSYNKDEDTLLKEGDYLVGLYKLSTLDTLLVFTNLGNYLYVPVYEIPEAKWKELGKHISNIIKLDPLESIVGCVSVTNFDTDDYITMFTKNGMVKRSMLSDFKVSRYSKPITAIKLKDDDVVTNIESNKGNYIFITTSNGFGLRYNISEVAPVGLRAAGVKAVSLKNDTVVVGHVMNEEEYLVVLTDKGTGKRIKMSEFEIGSRARKGIQMVRDVKTNPYHILRTFVNSKKSEIILKIGIDFKIINTTDLPITDRYSTGTQITKAKIQAVFAEPTLEEKNYDDEVVEIKEKIDLDDIDKKILTIDDFLDDFKMKSDK